MFKNSIKRSLLLYSPSRGIRITVHENFHVPLKRGQCIMDTLKPNNDVLEKVNLYYNRELRQAHLSFSSLNETVVSQHQFFRNVVAYELAIAHSEECPARAFSKLDLQKRNEFAPLIKNVKMAGCITLMDSRGKVLITKRNPFLSTFPGAWVLPGGSIDDGETLEAGSLREIIEETGIVIHRINGKYYYQAQRCRVIPFYLYESVFPDKDYLSVLKSQHLIIFFLAKLSVPSEKIPIVLNHSEVELAAWVPMEQVQDILNFRNGYLEDVYPKKFAGKIENKMLFPPYENTYGEGLGRAHARCLQYIKDAKLYI